MPINELDELFSEITDEDKNCPPREIDEDMKKIQEEFSNSDLFDES